MKFLSEHPDEQCWVDFDVIVYEPTPLDRLSDQSLQRFDRQQWPIIYCATEMLATSLTAPVVHNCNYDGEYEIVLSRVSFLWYALMVYDADKGDSSWLVSKNLMNSPNERFVCAWHNRISALLSKCADAHAEILTSLPKWMRTEVHTALGHNAVVVVPPLVLWAAASTLLAASSVWTASFTEHEMFLGQTFGAKAAIAHLPSGMHDHLGMSSSALAPPSQVDPRLTLVRPIDPHLLNMLLVCYQVPSDYQQPMLLVPGGPAINQRFEIELQANRKALFDKPQSVFTQMELLSALYVHDDARKSLPAEALVSVIHRVEDLRASSPSWMPDDVLLSSAPQMIDLLDQDTAKSLKQPLSLAFVNSHYALRSALSATPDFVNTSVDAHPYGPAFVERLPDGVESDDVMTVLRLSDTYANDALDYLCMIRCAAVTRGDLWWVRPGMQLITPDNYVLMHPLALRARAMRSLHAHAMINASKNGGGFSNRWLLVARELLMLSNVKDRTARDEMASIVCDMLFSMVCNCESSNPITSDTLVHQKVSFKLSTDIELSELNRPRLTLATAVCDDFLLPLFHDLLPVMMQDQIRNPYPFLFDGLLNSVAAITRAPVEHVLPRWPPSSLKYYMRYVWRRYQQWRGVIPLQAGEAVEPVFEQNPHIMQAFAWLYIYTEVSNNTVHDWITSAPAAPTSSANHYKKGKSDFEDDPNANDDDDDEDNSGMISRRRSKPKTRRVYFHRGMRNDMSIVENRFQKNNPTPPSDFSTNIVNALNAAGASSERPLRTCYCHVLQMTCQTGRGCRALLHVAKHAVLNNGQAFQSINDAISKKGGGAARRTGSEIRGKYTAASRLDKNPKRVRRSQGNSSSSSSSASVLSSFHCAENENSFDEEYNNNDDDDDARFVHDNDPSRLSKADLERIERTLALFILFSLPRLASRLYDGTQNMVPVLMLGTCDTNSCQDSNAVWWTRPRAPIADIQQHMLDCMNLCRSQTPETPLVDLYSLTNASDLSLIPTYSLCTRMTRFCRGLATIEALVSTSPCALGMSAVDNFLSHIPSQEVLNWLMSHDVPVLRPGQKIKPDTGAESLYFPYASMLTNARALWTKNPTYETPSALNTARFFMCSLPGPLRLVPGELTTRIAKAAVSLQPQHMSH